MNMENFPELHELEEGAKLDLIPMKKFGDFRNK